MSGGVNANQKTLKLNYSQTKTSLTSLDQLANYASESHIGKEWNRAQPNLNPKHVNSRRLFSYLYLFFNHDHGESCLWNFI